MRERANRDNAIPSSASELRPECLCRVILGQKCTSHHKKPLRVRDITLSDWMI